MGTILIRLMQLKEVLFYVMGLFSIVRIATSITQNESSAKMDFVGGKVTFISKKSHSYSLYTNEFCFKYSVSNFCFKYYF